MEVSCPEKRTVSFTRIRVITVGLTALGLITEVASYSILTPFYPSVARSKGNSATQIGIVLSVSSLVGFVSSPLIGKMLSSRITPKRGVLLGLIIDGAFLIFMAFVAIIEAPLGFFVASLLIRFVGSIGISMCFTGYYTLISVTFADNLEFVVPFMETVFGLGAMIGPAAGDLLYDLGGFRLPFFVFGGCSLVFAFLTYVLLPDEKSSGIHLDDAPVEEKLPKLKMSDLLRDHRVVFNLIAVISCYLVIGFNSSTLALWIEQFNLSISMSSLIFLTHGIVYSISNVINGFLSKRLEDCRLLVLIGGLVFCIGISCLGPLPFLPIEPTPWLTVLSQFLMGIGNAALYGVICIHSLKYVTQVPIMIAKDAI